MYKTYWCSISFCARNYLWGEESFSENKDCRESRRYVDQGSDNDQVWPLSKLDQYPTSLKIIGKDIDSRMIWYIRNFVVGLDLDKSSLR